MKKCMLRDPAVAIQRGTFGRCLPGVGKSGAVSGKAWKKTSRSISRVLSWTIIHLRQVSPPACSDLPESTVGHSIWIPIWSCSGWGLPSPRLLPAVRCALTAPFHPYLATGKWPGGILSVALSVGSRPPGVTWHPALWSPDFPP